MDCCLVAIAFESPLLLSTFFSTSCVLLDPRMFHPQPVPQNKGEKGVSVEEEQKTAEIDEVMEKGSTRCRHSLASGCI